MAQRFDREIRRFVSHSYLAVHKRQPLGRLRLLGLYVFFKLAGLFGGLRQVTLGRIRLHTPGFQQFVFGFEEIFLERCYFFQTANPEPRILDAGGNVGVSLAYFKTLYPRARIDVFEADPSCAKLLQSQADLNGWADCRVHACAVAEREGELTFYAMTHFAFSVFNSVHLERMKGGASREHRVPAVRLSTYIDGPVDLLKIDVEGAEMGVFRELAASGRLGLIDQMFIEYHHHIVPGADEFSAMLRLLEDHGFGYLITSPLRLPARRDVFQDFLIHAYRKKKASFSPAP